MRNCFLRADFHTHPLGDRYYPSTLSVLSPDDKSGIRSFLSAMVQRGVEVLACTDHNTVISGLWAKEIAKREGLPLVVIPGAEISVRGATQQMHLLALNITRDLPAGRLSVREAAREIRKQGGVAILAHPVKYPQEISLNPDIFLELDGIEATNASEGVFPVERYLDERSCYQNKFILQSTGSDLHWEPSTRIYAGNSRHHPFFPVPVKWLLEKGVISRSELKCLGNSADNPY